jgi:hypothetical protein
LYGTPRRDLDCDATLTTLKELLNTRDQQYGNIHINIEVDSPTQTRVQINRPKPLRSVVLMYYKLRYKLYGMDTTQFIEFTKTSSGRRFQNYVKHYDVVYWNPTPEFIASLVPRNYFIDIKLAYGWLLWHISGASKSAAMFKRVAPTVGLRTRGFSFNTFDSSYKHGLFSRQMKSQLVKLLGYAPWYVTSFNLLQRVILWYYSGYRLTILNLLGGYYGTGVNSYCLDYGSECIQFRKLLSGNIIEYVENRSERVIDGTRLTYLGLYKLLKKYDHLVNR